MPSSFVALQSLAVPANTSTKRRSDVSIPEKLPVELLVEEVVPKSHDCLSVVSETVCGLLSTPDCETSEDFLSSSSQVVPAILVFNCCSFLFKKPASVRVCSLGASQFALQVTKL